MRRPASNGTRASSRAWSTRVGTVTWPRSCVTSVPAKAAEMRAAISPETEMRCSSLNQSACSLVPSGMNCEVKSWRKAGFSLPQPSRIRVRVAASSSFSAALRAPGPADRIAAVQNQVRDALRMANRIADGDAAALRDPEQGEAFDRGGVRDRFQVTDEGLVGEVLDLPVRQPVAASVVADERVVSGQLAVEMTPDRALEVELQMGHPVARLHQGRPLPDLRVCELHTVGRRAEADLLRELERIRTRYAVLAARSLSHDGEDLHGPRDVLEAAGSERLELCLELAPDLIEDRAGHADSAGLRDALKAGGDIDTVAVDAGFVVNDVAQVDADPELHAPRLGHSVVPLRHDRLDLERALGGAAHARELGHNAVPCGVDDASAVTSDERQHHDLVPLEIVHRRRLVLAHEAAVPCNVSGQDGREPAIQRGVIHTRRDCGTRRLPPSRPDLTAARPLCPRYPTAPHASGRPLCALTMTLDPP